MNILAAIDFSDATNRLVPAITQFSKAHDAKVWLIHVAEEEPPGGFEVHSTTLRDAVAETYRDEHKRLQELAKELRDQKIDATALLIRGPAAETILQEAERLDTGAIIIGSHGHGALHDVLMGSTGSSVLRQSHCPVVVVPIRG
ncbi:universal stress protein [Pseudohalioglobus lutimaris]|uniref:universal stress protein n=1 Tax=Pseudohalioglobus lutimaris TaxID=1737061 RepID=UPI00096B961C|nr:universal stress protein [Pseudohalioglobus lutimaris]